MKIRNSLGFLVSGIFAGLISIVTTTCKASQKSPSYDTLIRNWEDWCVVRACGPVTLRCFSSKAIANRWSSAACCCVSAERRCVSAIRC
jgi:hypothetical protein